MSKKLVKKYMTKKKKNCCADKLYKREHMLIEDIKRLAKRLDITYDEAEEIYLKRRNK